ncbi:MAG TPA: lytic transglycosylase domain-containing protein [Streptosporangiaceae bacterium]|nr:lytic transglycosylase domain-containing protein [Streptosporangiaceae bacterium]
MRALAASGAVVLLAGVVAMRPAPTGVAARAAASPSASATAGATTTSSSSFRKIISPDLLVIEPSGLSTRQLAKINAAAGVHQVVTADGAAIKLNGHRVNVLGVNPGQFRSWTPLATATNQRVWTALRNGRFVASDTLTGRHKLHPGRSYLVTGARQERLTYAGSAPLGIVGIDALVGSQASAQLGLVPRVLALVNAPGTSMSRLIKAVRKITGRTATLVSLRPAQQRLPVDPSAGGSRPTNYLQLFQASAARYCPGMSWTVLAAIGQIESGDGSNMGPSSAGALGPMQFLPSTWRQWGITAFGETGAPDIMNPFDAVPAAARLLCADGAGSPSGLRGAIFSYNHATWYVNEVLALAQQYARDYG